MPNTKIDLHMHSNNSPDGYNSVNELCQQAITMGVGVIAVTDHCECQAFYDDDTAARMAKSYADITEAKALFADKLIVTRGIESGQPNQNRKAEAEILSSHKFDFVMASLHNARDSEDYYYMDYTNPDLDLTALMRKYFKELLEIADECNYDCLAHLTYPIRYFGKPLSEIDLSPFDADIDAILRRVAARNKALEINLSGIRKGLGFTQPHLPILQKFRELGGKYITIGSDAHRKLEVGSNIDDGIELARQAGFESITYYVQREPIQLKIEN